MSQVSYRALGLALALGIVAASATATAQTIKAPHERTSAAAQAAPSQSAAPSGQNYAYQGPPIIHISGEKMGMYPKFYDTRQPGVLQNLVDTYGPGIVQDAVDSSALECRDIYDLQVELADYDKSVAEYGAEGQKLMKDLPRHVGWQMFLTGAQGVALGLVGAAAHSPEYTFGAGIGTVKQWGNDRWSGRLDKHFLHGSDVTVKGMRVFLASERIYVREMDKYCPLLESYIQHYGNRVGFTPTQTSYSMSYTPAH